MPVGQPWRVADAAVEAAFWDKFYPWLAKGRYTDGAQLNGEACDRY